MYDIRRVTKELDACDLRKETNSGLCLISSTYLSFRLPQVLNAFYKSSLVFIIWKIYQM